MSALKLDVVIRYPDQFAFTYPNTVASGAVGSINAGEPTIKSTSGNVADMATTEPTTSQDFTGIAKMVSTDTVAAAGAVILYMPFPGLVYDTVASTPSAANTAALIAALQFKRVTYTKTGSTFTVNTGASDATTNGLCIVGGDPNVSHLFYVILPQVSIFGNVTT